MAGVPAPACRKGRFLADDPKAGNTLLRICVSGLPAGSPGVIVHTEPETDGPDSSPGDAAAVAGPTGTAASIPVEPLLRRSARDGIPRFCAQPLGRR